jgi:gliding motility-associated-like protein
MCLIAQKNYRRTLLVLIFLSFTFSLKAQNYIQVPFNSGFVGDNDGNNKSINTVTLSSLGWGRAFFAQNSNSNIFVAQGNDIIGEVILEFQGVSYTIPGFVKWRAPSGTVTTMVFQPNLTSNIVIPTSTGSYTITNSKYIGLTFNGRTLTITGGVVTGNAATSGLLTLLNDYLAEVRANDPNGPVTVNSLTTISTTPTLTGTVTLATGETLSVQVNGKNYKDTGPELTVSGNNWTLAISDPIPAGTYNVVAVITNSSGYTLTDATTDELKILTVSTTLSTISASPNQILANGASTSTVNVQLKDSSGNNINISGGTVLISSTAGTLGSTVNNNNGTYSAILTSNTTPGTVATLSFTINGTLASNTASVSFVDNITTKPITDAAITISPIDDVTYNGIAQTPPLLIKDNGNTLTENQDYTLSYSNNTNAGTATVLITGQGNYTGSTSITFTVLKRTITVSADPDQTKERLAADPVFTYTSSESLLPGNSFSGALSRDPGETPGQYNILIGTLSAGNNYQINFVTAPFKIADTVKPDLNNPDLDIELDEDTGEYKTEITLPEGEQNVGTFKADEGVEWTLEPRGPNDDTPLFEMVVNQDGSVTVRFLSPAQPGTYIVNLCATDAAGNKTCITITIIVNDDIPPTIDSNKGVTKDPNTGEYKTEVTLPEGEQTVGNFTADEDVVWTLEPTGAKDDTPLFEMIVNQDGSVTVRFRERSRPGTYVVNLCATDSSGNKTCVTITIIVRDDTPPTLDSNKGVTKDPNTGEFKTEVTLPEGERTVGRFTADEEVKWTLEPKGPNNDTPLFEMLVNQDGSVTVMFKERSIPGTYVVNLCATDTAGNKTCITITVIVIGELSRVVPTQWIQIPWGSYLPIPDDQKVITSDGVEFTVKAKVNEQPLNRFRRGDYYLDGNLILPNYLKNSANLKADIRVRVLPKPAPLNILLSNNTFQAPKNNDAVFVGTLTVVDPVDNRHLLELPNELNDNKYFSIVNRALYWSSTEALPGRVNFKITVKVTDFDGNVINRVFDITRLRIRVEDINIYNTFTPEGDGMNDNWGVPEIRYYVGARIEVFEKSGKRVFYTEDFSKRWDGTYNGKDMAVGNYYWVLEVKETGTLRKGIVHLLRK